MNSLTGLSGDPRRRAFVNARLADPASGLEGPGGVLIESGRIIASGGEVSARSVRADEVIDCGGGLLFPGLIDMRVFTGEPGNEHRETLRSAARAAAAGGVTTMIVMPDTEPVIDEAAIVDFILRRARDTAIVRVAPMAAITRGLKGAQMSETGLLREAGAVALTDGRRGVASSRVLRRAMAYARDFGMLIAQHVEDADLAGEGVMNEGELSARLGLPGIPRQAEIIMLERDIRLVELTGARYHAAQISCAESLEIIRKAKDAGLPVTCGVSVNHLTLNEDDIGAYRTFFKLSPPLRREEDRAALVAGVADGTIDVIVSAHDPQDADTKRLPFAEAASGAIGLETLFSAAMSLHKSGEIPLPRLIEAMSAAPARLLDLEGGSLAPGRPADFVIADMEAPWRVDPERLRSLSKNTAFEDRVFDCRVVHTVVAGRTVFSRTEAPSSRKKGAGGS